MGINFWFDVIFLYILIFMFFLWVFLIVILISFKIVGCKGLYRYDILLFVLLIVRVYWIRLFVFMLKKLIFLVKIFDIIAAVGVFIIIFILMFCE